jgi:hypothetical protein
VKKEQKEGVKGMKVEVKKDVKITIKGGGA